MLNKISKFVAAHIPGTALNRARQKRRMEKQLRAEGHSRTQAMTLVNQHFRKQLENCK
jgi:hypothetical protein